MQGCRHPKVYALYRRKSKYFGDKGRGFTRVEDRIWRCEICGELVTDEAAEMRLKPRGVNPTRGKR